MQPLVLIGYFPKKVVQRSASLKAAHVTAVRNASGCLSSGPPGWIQHWTHNEMWVYSTIDAALAVMPQDERGEYELQAYRMLAIRWDAGRGMSIVLPTLNVEAVPASFHSVGFDAVSIQAGVAGFGCSPLSCNAMAEEIETNEHCLLPTQQLAEHTALRFSIDEPEPGPFYVIEVLLTSDYGRWATPFAAQSP
jgi:hypothetical protein